jgi:hypothetical protein
MAIDIGGAKIEGGSDSFVIKNTSDINVYGREFASYGGTTYGKVTDAKRPMFVAGTNGNAAWWTYATSAWAKVNTYATTTTVNVGNHYNTSTTRFTAPITGPYVFWSTGYDRSTSYWHPQFAVNGSTSTRRVNTPYRMRQHGQVSNYVSDSQMQELIYLTAGDYVEVYYYAGGTGQVYPRYMQYGGMYVG